MRSKIVTKPSVEPISLTEAKKELRLVVTDLQAAAYTDEDAKLSMIITSARELCETITGRALITQTWDAVFDSFPCSRLLALPWPQLQSITSVSYTDIDGNSATFAGFDADLFDNGARLKIDVQDWPSIHENTKVTVRFVAGYGDTAADVPASIKRAMFLLIGHMHANPEATAEKRVDLLPLGVDANLAEYRVSYL